MDFSMETLAYVSGLIYRKFHPIWFILYMYAEYDKILKRSVKYHIRQPHPLLDDLNNIVLVPEKNLYKSDRFLKLIWGDVAENRTRLVRVIPSVDCKPHEVHLGALLLYNLNIPVPKHEIVVELHDCKNGNSIKYAEEVDVSLIRYPGEISHATVDLLLQNYFMFPKLVYKNDIIQVDLRRYGERFFYTNFKINQVTSVSFKCNRVVYGGKEQTGGFFCFYGVTTLKQSADCQSFLPDSPNNCPYGLCDEFYKIHKAVVPFLRKKVNLNPVFLLQGEAGCGKETLVRCLAKVLGMHFYYVSNSELAASVYAQNETKLRNVFFNAQMSAPCIVFINNFENFGKNNDGQFDERLIGNFATELNLLFNKTNPFPILLFCASNSKTVASNLQRLFLEVIKITAPNDWNRKNMLQWILEQDKIAYSCDLDKVANKTHGFFFNDLRALVYYARRDKEQILTEIDFSNAVDFMQVAYNSSLGAPKVPKVQWDDVGGLTEVKNEIIRTINLPLKHPDLLKASGLHRTGILLFGPPGTGKTLLAKAVATECNLCFLSVKGPELLNMYVGQSEENVREVFEKARQASPCIIFFDELDSLAPNRGLSGDSGGVMDRVVSQLLAEMDGLNENESSTVFIIGATNRPDLIDPALLRPGRFDKLLYVGPCVDFQSKVAVFKALTRKFKLADDVNIDELVKSCPDNVTGADFYGICSTAWASAVGKLIKKLEEEECTIITDTTSEEVRVCSEDFKAAISNVKPSITKDDLLYFEQLQKELASNL